MLNKLKRPAVIINLAIFALIILLSFLSWFTIPNDAVEIGLKNSLSQEESASELDENERELVMEIAKSSSSDLEKELDVIRSYDSFTNDLPVNIKLSTLVVGIIGIIIVFVAAISTKWLFLLNVLPSVAVAGLGSIFFVALSPDAGTNDSPGIEYFGGSFTFVLYLVIILGAIGAISSLISPFLLKKKKTESSSAA